MQENCHSIQFLYCKWLRGYILTDVFHTDCWSPPTLHGE